jgi:uncharacterized membrane protein (Fun14 family)
MNIENISSFGATIGGGFFAGALIGFALIKVLKINTSHRSWPILCRIGVVVR